VPIYEYECKKCGLEFEVIQGFSDKPVRKCETCGGKVRKLVSQSSFHLKGTGWYVTDYASKKPGSKAAGEGHQKSESKSDSKSDSKSESKSDSKADNKTPAKKKSKSKD
jgi:putative FmdB family regulatory protein